MRAYAGVILDYYRWAEARNIATLRANAGNISSYLQDVGQRFRIHLGREIAVSTHNQIVSALQGFFKFLVENGVRHTMPFIYGTRRMLRHGILKGAQQTRYTEKNLSFQPVFSESAPSFPAKSDVSTFVKTLSNQRDRAIALTLWKAGLRVSELKHITIRTICRHTLAGGKTTATREQAIEILDEAVHTNSIIPVRIIGKGKKERLVPIRPDLAAELSLILQLRMRSEEDCVFIGERGIPISAAGVQAIFRRHSSTSNIKLTPHQLRHAFALDWLSEFKRAKPNKSSMAADLEALKMLSLMMGHTYASTTEIYWRYLNLYIRR